MINDSVGLRPALALVTAAALAVLSACASAPAATPERGEMLYGNYCAQCHKAEGGGQESVGAPSIAGLPEWYVYEQLTKFRSGVRGAYYEDAEGLRMRPMALTLKADEDVRAVSMYVASMASAAPAVATVHGDPEKGAKAFATCTACHGADGKGNEQLGAPPLTLQPDWYLVRQLGKFKSGVRGANPKDVKGATMRPMAATLADEQAMHDVISHVMTLRK
jgi:cytochrome c553